MKGNQEIHLQIIKLKKPQKGFLWTKKKSSNGWFRGTHKKNNNLKRLSCKDGWLTDQMGKNHLGLQIKGVWRFCYDIPL